MAKRRGKVLSVEEVLANKAAERVARAAKAKKLRELRKEAKILKKVFRRRQLLAGLGVLATIAFFASQKISEPSSRRSPRAVGRPRSKRHVGRPKAKRRVGRPSLNRR